MSSDQAIEAEEKAEKTKVLRKNLFEDRHSLPLLKQLDPNRVPSEYEVHELIKKGMLSEDLITTAEPNLTKDVPDSFDEKQRKFWGKRR